MKSFIICTVHPIFEGSQTKENEIGGICSTHGEMRNTYILVEETTSNTYV
jgi:hypothetical protein